FNKDNTTATQSDGLTVRQNGDMLVLYDFGGSGTPMLTLLRWLDGIGDDPVSGLPESTLSCYNAHAFPCWGDGTLGNLTTSGSANGAAASDGKSGEAGIDLTAAGVFGSACESFGDAILKSRSSSSFTAEMKDFIVLPDHAIDVSNCGEIKILKTDD